MERICGFVALFAVAAFVALTVIGEIKCRNSLGKMGLVMRTERECLAEAERCEQQARLCANPGFGAKLRKIAEQWRELAAEAHKKATEAPITLGIRN